MGKLKRFRGLSQQLLLLLLAVAIVSACSSTIIKHSKIPASETLSTPCRVVQHRMGETCVPNHPKRIVTISWRSLLGNMLALGVKPVGSSSISDDFNATYVSDQSHLSNQVEGIKNIGLTNLTNLERILLLKPDLILAWEYSEAIYPLLSQIAPTVIIPFYGIDWRQRFNITAQALGKEAVAQQVWNHYERRIQELKIALGNRYQNKTISIAFAWGQSAYILVKNSFPGSILEDLGLQRPPAQAVSAPDGQIGDISEERLDLIDGDLLFFGTSVKEYTEAYESLKQKPLWKKLKAVQKGQVYLFDFSAWQEGSPLAADVVLDDLYKYLVANHDA